ncbi:MAG: hypothetical protein CMO49_03725 [Verrucomicrobiales bacterium]|nr:hypothetical protein [Verrucomicrobiales bacterium]
MKYHHYLLAFIILGVISCSKKDVEETTSNETNSETPIVTNSETKNESQTNSDSGANTETEAPAKEVNDVSGEHSVVAKRLMDLMNDFIDNLTTAQDVESAKNAVAKFDEIAVNFEKIVKEMESLGLPDGQEAEAIKTLFSDTEKVIQEKMGGMIGILSGNQEIGKIITPALNTFGQRMDKLSPLMEKWAGNVSKSSDPEPAIPINEVPLEETVEPIEE